LKIVTSLENHQLPLTTFLELKYISMEVSPTHISQYMFVIPFSWAWPHVRQKLECI